MHVTKDAVTVTDGARTVWSGQGRQAFRPLDGAGEFNEDTGACDRCRNDDAQKDERGQVPRRASAAAPGQNPWRRGRASGDVAAIMICPTPRKRSMQRGCRQRDRNWRRTSFVPASALFRCAVCRRCCHGHPSGHPCVGNVSWSAHVSSLVRWPPRSTWSVFSRWSATQFLSKLR